MKLRCLPSRLRAPLAARPLVGVGGMRGAWLSLLVLLVPLLALLSPAPASASATVRVVTNLERVKQDAAPTGATRAEVSAARGETASFQLVVSASGSDLRHANVTAFGLVGPDGRTLPASLFTLYREHYVHVVAGSPDLKGANRPLGPGWYPDGLIPFVDPRTGLDLAGASIDAAPFDVAAGRNQPVWVDLAVPRDAPAGAYEGSLTVTADGIDPILVPVSLLVRDFELPLRPALHSNFGYQLSRFADKRAHEVLIEHRIMPVVVSPPDSRDLTDRLGLNGTALWFAGYADKSACTIDPPPSVEKIRAAIAAYPPGLELIVWPADEVDDCVARGSTMVDILKAWARNTHEAGADTLVTVLPHPTLQDDGSGSGRSAVDIWCLLPSMYDDDGVADELEIVRRKGDRVWSYTALVQDSYSPKWELDFPPIDFRMTGGFLSQSLGLTGLLYWEVDNWTSSPWTLVPTDPHGTRQYPGEGMLVYPAAPVGLPGVVPSMRLKFIRDGVVDYDYVEILKRLCATDEALAFARSVGADWSHWTQDPAELLAVREALGARIEQLTRDRSRIESPERCLDRRER